MLSAAISLGHLQVLSEWRWVTCCCVFFSSQLLLQSTDQLRLVEHQSWVWGLGLERQLSFSCQVMCELKEETISNFAELVYERLVLFSGPSSFALRDQHWPLSFYGKYCILLSRVPKSTASKSIWVFLQNKIFKSNKKREAFLHIKKVQNTESKCSSFVQVDVLQIRLESSKPTRTWNWNVHLVERIKV